MADELKAWFLEDQSQTGHDLLRKLQAAYPNTYSSGLLRTVQRRLKVWRGELARELVFGVSPSATPLMACDALRNVEASRVTGHQLSSLREEAGTAQDHSVEATA